MSGPSTPPAASGPRSTRSTPAGDDVGVPPLTADPTRRPDGDRPERSVDRASHGPVLVGGTTLGVTTLAVAVTLTALGVGGGLSPSELLDPGVLTRWGLPAVRAGRDLAAALTVGTLVVVATLMPAGGDGGRLRGPAATATAVAGGAGAVWTAASLLTLVLTYSEVSGTPLSELGGPAVLIGFATELELGRSLAVSLALVALATLLATAATRITTAAFAAVTSVAALLPLALTGHAAGASNHEASVDTQAAHLIGITVWVGGLMAVFLLRRRLGDGFAPVLRRYSTVAGWAFLLVAVSGVGGALVRVGSVGSLVSPYGALLAGKTAALALLGLAGWWHRRRLLARIDAAGAGAGRAFARLAAAELAIMAVATGLGVALSRTSPPPRPTAGATSLTDELLGYPMPPELGLEQWFTQWRLDTVWAPVALVAVAWYVAAAVRLRRRGDRWPLPRSVLWVLGWLVLVYATSGAPKVYGRVLFSMHMVEHMTIGTLVPILLVLGAPVTLALRTTRARADGSRGPREWLLVLVHSRVFRVLGHAAVAPVVFVFSLIAFYNTPALDLSLRTHTGHVLMAAHFLVVGYLFAWVICGPDPGPRRPDYPIRLLILIATMAFHAFFGVSMMSATEVMASDWFGSLERPWGPTLLQDQYRGGALAWGLGDYPVAILAVAMALAWIRDDDRETRRYDRRADRDGDTELAAYNAMLAARASRDRASHGSPASRSGSGVGGRRP